MLRWLLVVTLCACSSACKIVHSTAGDGGINNGVPTVGFVSPATNLTEAAGPFDIVVSLNTPVDRTVTVTYTAIADTATEGVDFEVFGSSVTFAPGQTAAYIQLAIRPDAEQELDESFAIDLLTADGATLDDRRHVITIVANAVPTVAFDMPSQFVDEWQPSYFIVNLSETTGNSVGVNFAISGTATAADRQLTSGTVTIPPGSIRYYIDLGVVDDTFVEPNETVIMTLTSATNAVITTPSLSTYTIVDDDTPPYVGFSTTYQRIPEGNAGSTLATVNVYLTAASAETVTVPFTLDSTNTAVLDQDFALTTSSPLIFSPGTTTTSITVSITGDSTVEGTENIGIRLGTPTNALIAPPQVTTLSIGNDECLGTGAFAVCPDAPLNGAIVLPAELDTDSSPYCTWSLLDWAEDNQPSSCVVFAQTISGGTTLVRGYRPLILAATDSITISGVLDVSGRRNVLSPGAYFATCPPPTVPGSRSGGAGGSFMTAGGNGGNHSNPATPGGIAAPATGQPPATLRGGCSGQLGADNFTGGADYGTAGGAVYLVAGGSITLQPGAAINASGDAGAISNTAASAGGSGGGSGGMIMLYAPLIQAAMAYLVANGGGGSEGTTSNGNGNGGSVPDPTDPFTAAAGGTGTPAGNGGSGFAQGSPAAAGAASSNTNGGGGGGGGGGYITANQPLTGALVSPTAQ